LWESLLETSPQPPPKFHLVFEDDAVVQNDFIDLLNEWYHRTASFKNMDFVHLYVFDYHARDLQNKTIHKTFDGLSGLQCYIIRHSHLKKLVDQIKPLITTIDEQVTRLPIKSYFIYDDFVTHGTIQSENKYRP
jgi:GR25 family glycosyltransferase involved in LPS biosynthesis